MGDEEDDEVDASDHVASESPSDRPAETTSSFPKEGRRRRLEGVIPEIVRRAVELGVEKASEAPDNLKQFVGDMKVPKDIAHYLLGQIDETKNGLFRVVAKEIRDFLEHTNFAGEVQKLLTTVQFEVNTTIRFTPNDTRDKRREPEGEEEAAEEGAEPDAAAGSTASADEHGKTSDPSPRGRGAPLPTPEVKTSVHVRREERDRRRRS
jgi:hypothetical protein